MDSVSIEHPLNIGRMIFDYITNNNISIESAAEMAKIDVDEFRNILNEPSMETDTLKRISVALNHNFMTEIADFVDKELGNC